MNTARRAANNTAHIMRARKAVHGYAGEKRDLRANIVDMLTDMRYLCAAKGIDFYAANDMAEQHYLAEEQAACAKAVIDKVMAEK